MRYIFKVDNIEVGNPDNWETLTTTIKRDESSRGLLLTQDATITFSNEAYKLFSDKINGDGFCAKSIIEIYEDCEGSGNHKRIFKGISFISDCEFDIDKCVVSIKVQDNSYYARINNNKSLAVSLKGNKSKNGVLITPCSLITINMFDPCSPSTTATRKGILVRDAMQYLISFMTDGEVLFSCPPLEAGGDFYGLCLTTGETLSNYFATTINPLVSFQSAFENLWKKLNLSFYIDESTSKPTLILDYTSQIFNSTTLFALDDVAGLKQTVLNQELYASVKFGSDTTLEETIGDCSTGAFSENVDFLGCKSEQYVVLGNCNIDRTLDLVTSWIVSSNVIQDAYINSNDQYNDSIFLIDCDYDSPGVYNAIKDNNLTGDVTVTAFYNTRLFNYNVAPRFLGAIPQSIANFLSPDGGSISATRNTSTILNVNGIAPAQDSVPPLFMVELSDVSGAYNPVTGEYSPASNTPCVIHVDLDYTMNKGNASQEHVYFYLDVYDSFGYAGGSTHLLRSVLIGSNYHDFAGTYHFSNSITTMLNTGEKALVRAKLETNAQFFFGAVMTITASGSLTINKINEGLAQTYNPDDYAILLYSFTHPLTSKQVAALKSNPRGRIAFTAHNKTYYGWANDIKINDVTGITDLKLRSSKNRNGSN